MESNIKIPAVLFSEMLPDAFILEATEGELRPGIRRKHLNMHFKQKSRKVKKTNQRLRIKLEYNSIS